MATVHVLPVGDLIAHEDVGDDCPCGPAVEHVPGERGDGWLIIHNSLDGRERFEDWLRGGASWLVLALLRSRPCRLSVRGTRGSGRSVRA